VRALWENLPNIILGGLLFALLCTPTFVLFVLGWMIPALITVPLLVAPAWSALMRLHASLLEGKATTVAEMGRAIPRYWRASFRLGVMGIVPLYVTYRLLPALATITVSWWVWVAFFVALLATAFVCALYLYAFPLTVLYNSPTTIALTNSALLASRYANNTVGLLSMGLLFSLVIAYLTLALLFILPTIYALFIVNHCRMVIGENQDG
jgi:hypothetical protein